MALEWREDITLQIARPKTTPSRQISLSADGRFLAIALGNGADIWDTNDRLIASQPTYRLKSSAPIVWLKWFPKESCLICTHEDARVYIATFTQDGFSTVGFRTNGSHDTAKMAAILNERLIAVGYTHFVEIRLKTTERHQVSWNRLGLLPSPPAINGVLAPEALIIESVHSMHANNVTVSYKGLGLTDTLVVSWHISSLEPLSAEIDTVREIQGVITDVSGASNSILVMDSGIGAYRVISLGSANTNQIFFPRKRDNSVAQPVSFAEFLDADCIVGTGAGQMVVWKEDGRRLQNLIFRNCGDNTVDFLSSAYDETRDVGWIAALIQHTDRADIVLWRTVLIDGHTAGHTHPSAGIWNYFILISAMISIVAVAYTIITQIDTF